jgi:hypothetical protein
LAIGIEKRTFNKGFSTDYIFVARLVTVTKYPAHEKSPCVLFRHPDYNNAGLSTEN